MSLGHIFILGVVFWVVYILLYRTPPEATTNNIFTLTEQDISLLENSPDYYSLGQAMVDCVSGCYHRCNLEQPAKLLSHLAPVGKRVTCDPQRGVMFKYVFSRAIAGKSGMSFLYSTTDTSRMVSVLNQSLGNYTAQRGYRNLQIVAHGNLLEGQVFFSIVPFTMEEIQQTLYILKNGSQEGY